jgi:hypothetical protein
MGPGISVVPYIPVPIGGVGSETLVRDMIDLDCWILSTGAGHNSYLSDSREMFWRLVLDPARGGGGGGGFCLNWGGAFKNCAPPTK